MDPGENVFRVVITADYKGFVLFFFDNGKVAKVPLSAYETKTNRKKLTGAYSDKSPLKTAMVMSTDEQVAVYSPDSSAVIVSPAPLLPQPPRNTQGVGVMSIKKKAAVSHAERVSDCGIVNQSRYRTRTLPSAGAILKPEDAPEKQISFEV